MSAPSPAYRLLLDVQGIQSPVHRDRGIARYVLEHARALMRTGCVDALLLNPNLPFPSNLDEELLLSPLLRWNTATELRRLRHAADAPLAYHLMSPFEVSPWAAGDVPTHALRSGLPIVATLYDLIPLVDADRYLADEGYRRRFTARLELFELLDLVFTISANTRSDALRLLGLAPERVVEIGTGVPPTFGPPGVGDDPAALLREELPAIDRPFTLTVAGEDPRKNTERLLDAWTALPPGVRERRQLVVTCDVGPGALAGWRAHAAAGGLAPADVVFTGRVDDETLRALYRQAELFVFPSLYEGFGLPAAEAMACGAPVVTSSASALPEVVGWTEATFDATDTAAMAAVIERGQTDGDFRAELRRRGAARAAELTWPGVAERTVRALELLGPTPITAPSGPATSPPLRLALVGPMPPTRSGIADYNARLVRSLTSRCEVDVYTDHVRPEALGDVEVAWFRWQALGRVTNPWSYDAVIYTIGNSDDHHDLYELAQELPGLLWMHDVRLSGLYVTYAQERVPDGRGRAFLEERLRRQYRRRLPFVPHDDLSLEPTTHYANAGLGLTRELVDVATGVIVSSRAAARLVHLDLQPGSRLPPTWVMPLAAPPVEPGERWAASDPPVVASFGMVAPVKGAELLVRALPALLAAVPGARLVFVGPVDRAYRSHLEDLAARLGVAGHLELTGHVEPGEYRRRLLSATCAAQLRTTTNGESSAAVLDCLAAGVPVVSSVAATAEVPPGTVEWVRPRIGPPELGEVLAALLTDQERLQALADAGRRHATRWSFDDVADRLLELVGEVQRPPTVG